MSERYSSSFINGREHMQDEGKRCSVKSYHLYAECTEYQIVNNEH